MTIYGRDKEPHQSHEMSEWESSPVTILTTTRFSDWRECKRCGGEQARTAAGAAMDDELALPCPYGVLPVEGKSHD